VPRGNRQKHDLTRKCPTGGETRCPACHLQIVSATQGQGKRQEGDLGTLRRYGGRIAYRDPVGVCGREDFAIDVRDDGRTLRAYCEIDDGHITRDASWTLGPDHRPVEGHVRVVQDGALVGSSFYTFDDHGTRCETLAAHHGRQSLVQPDRPRYLGLHPLIGDAMIALARGTDALGEERMIPTITCSRDINGETELTAIPMDIGVRYCGQEQLTVAAGRFVADIYELNWGREWPPARMWVCGLDAIFLRMEWSVSGRIYELVSLASSDGPYGPQFAAAPALLPR